MSFLGADTDELRQAGQKCLDAKETTDEVIAFLQALIAVLYAASWFTGGASAAYATYLETQVVPWLQRISMALGLFAKVLMANAEAQDRVSAGESVDFSTLPTYQTPSLPSQNIGPWNGSCLGTAPGSSTAPHCGTFDEGTGVDGIGTARPVAPVEGGSGTPVGAAGGIGSGALGSGAAGAGGSLGAGGGSAGSSGGLGAGSLDGALGGSPDGSSDGGGTHVTSSPNLGHELGGGLPGGDPSDASTGGAPVATGEDGQSYGAAVGLAGGAAALGLGGAALAGRGGTGDPEIDRLAAAHRQGDRGGEVRDLQERLTEAGYDTQGADGVWGPHTQAAYDAYRVDHPIDLRQGEGFSSPDGFDYNQITGVRNNANVTPEFLREVEGVAQRLGARPEHLMAAMSFETGGTFAADVSNPRSSATGLIQFMSGTARGLGTTTADLARMTPTEQLAYVERYFEPYRGRLGDLESVYTTILAGHPASGDQVLFSAGDRAYGPNRELDTNHDGQITAAEASTIVRRRLGAGAH